MVALRPFRPSDQPAARDLIENALGEHFGFVDRTANVDLIDIGTCYATPNAFFVAESGGNLIGTTGLLVVGDTGRLVRVAVAAQHRRSGVAAALLSYVVEYARRSGLSQLVAHTQPEWADAIGFYTAQGFAQYGRDEIDVYLRRGVADAQGSEASCRSDP